MVFKAGDVAVCNYAGQFRLVVRVDEVRKTPEGLVYDAFTLHSCRRHGIRAGENLLGLTEGDLRTPPENMYPYGREA